MKLGEAFLCLDCEEVFASGTGFCPGCGSSSVEKITRWIGEIRPYYLPRLGEIPRRGVSTSSTKM